MNLTVIPRISTLIGMGNKVQDLFSQLSQKCTSPYMVQRLIYSLGYNDEKNGETVRSAYLTWKKREAHCLEAAFLAAAILEAKGYPPLVMSIESVDQLDHVIYIFQQAGRWGAIGRSRDLGLHGRAPVFKSPKDLALSYVEPFVDKTGKVRAFGVANLNDTKTDWKFSHRNLWKAEQYLIDLRHHQLTYSSSKYKRAKTRYDKTGQPCLPEKFWW